jgi:biotin-(acetyl-CoA carboxylase) ligase
MLVAGVLAEMRDASQWLEANRREDICRAWRTFGRAGLDGAPVRWHDRGAVRRGRARDLDEDGALLVETADAVERLVAGEVHWETLARG